MTRATELAQALGGHLVVVGIGNPRRGDDGAGSLLARRLAGTPGITSFDAEDVPESWVGPIAAAVPDFVLLVDAVHLGQAPGTVALARREDLVLRGADTHRPSLYLMMEYLERTTRAPIRLLAIQPKELGLDAPMSPEVEASVAALVRILRGLGRRPAAVLTAEASA